MPFEPEFSEPVKDVDAGVFDPEDSEPIDDESYVNSLVGNKDIDEVELYGVPGMEDLAVEVAKRRAQAPFSVADTLDDAGRFAGGVVTGAMEMGPSLVKGAKSIPSNLLTIGKEAITSTIPEAYKFATTGSFDTKKIDPPASQRARREIASAAELGTVGVANMARVGARRGGELIAEAGNPLIKTQDELTTEEWRERLATDLAWRKHQAELVKGNPQVLPVASGMTPEELAAAGTPIRGEDIEGASEFFDPTNLTAANLGIKAGAKGLAPGLVNTATGYGLRGIGKTLKGISRVADIPNMPLVKSARNLGVAASALTGNFTPLAAAAGTEAVKRGARSLGSRLDRVGAEVLGQAVDKTQSNFGRIIDRGIKGTAAGGVAGAGFAFGAESPEQAGAQIGGSGLIGGAAGTGAEVGMAGRRMVFDSPFKNAKTAVVAYPEFDYGVEPDLDAGHKDVMSRASPESKTEMNGLRNHMRDVAEIYELPDAQFDALPEVAGNKAQGVYVDKRHGERPVIFVREGARARWHEVGHPLWDMMPDDAKKAVREGLLSNNDPGRFASGYETRLQGAPVEIKWDELTPEQQEKYIGEMASEHLQAVANGLPITSLTTDPSLTRRIQSGLGRVAESIGLPTTTDDVQTALGVKPSFKAALVMENALRERAGQVAQQPPIQTQAAPVSDEAITKLQNFGATPESAKAALAQARKAAHEANITDPKEIEFFARGIVVNGEGKWRNPLIAEVAPPESAPKGLEAALPPKQEMESAAMPELNDPQPKFMPREGEALEPATQIDGIIYKGGIEEVRKLGIDEDKLAKAIPGSVTDRGAFVKDGEPQYMPSVPKGETVIYKGVEREVVRDSMMDDGLKYGRPESKEVEIVFLRTPEGSERVLVDDIERSDGASSFMPMEEFRHWSKEVDLTELDPKFYGKGMAGAEKIRKQTYPDLWIDRTYIGLEGYKKEGLLPENEYKGQIDTDRVYDLSKDPEDFAGKAWSQIKADPDFADGDRGAARTLTEKLIRDAGHQGYHDGKGAAAIFEPLKVKRSLADAGVPESRLSKATIEDKIGAIDIPTEATPQSRRIQELDQKWREQGLSFKETDELEALRTTEGKDVIGRSKYMPSDHPDAIKEAAVKDLVTGAIVTGPSHWHADQKLGLANELQDGFVTNSGEFLTRIEAHVRAKKHNQMRKSMVTPQYGIGTEDLKYMPSTRLEKEAESLGLKYNGDMEGKGYSLHTYNDPITKSTITVRSDAEPGTLQQKLRDTRDKFGNALKFMPSENPDAIKFAALRTEDGRIFTGMTHAEAFSNAFDTFAKENPKMSRAEAWEKVGDYDDGYVDGREKWYDRFEALEQAKKIKQVTKRGYEKAADYYAPDKGEGFYPDYNNLESLNFARARKFMPAAEPAIRGAEEYVKKSGIGRILPRSDAKVDVARARRIGEAYESLPVSDESPETKQSYQTFVDEVNRQYDHAVESGIKFEFTKEDPYKNSDDMIRDVESGRLKVFTGGDDHPFLGESTRDETGLTANDKFRAVHDLYGHASEGNQFGPQGEERAWRKHSAMFSDEARPAMTSETRGQNSWVNYGPHMFDKDGWRGDKEHPNYLAPKDRPYAEQKATLLPSEFSQVQFMPEDEEDGGAKIKGDKVMAQGETFDLTSEVTSKFMPAEGVDLNDYADRKVISLPSDRMGVGQVMVGPKGGKVPVSQDAQGGRGFINIFNGGGWSFSDKNSADRFLKRAKTLEAGKDKVLAAVTILSDMNHLKNQHGQLSYVEALEAAQKQGILTKKDLDAHVKSMAESIVESKSKTLSKPTVEKFQQIKSFKDFSRAVRSKSLNFGDAAPLLEQMNRKTHPISEKDATEIGVSPKDVAKDIADPELVDAPFGSVVALFEIDTTQAPSKSDFHYSYPWNVHGKRIGFLKDFRNVSELTSDKRIFNKAGRVVAQPLQMVLPQLDLIGREAESKLSPPKESQILPPEGKFMPQVDDLGFYSKLEQVAEDKLPNKGSAQQILATLKSNGVKPDELKWSGLDDFLATNPSPTKQQILDHVRENNVQLKEVVKGEPANIRINRDSKYAIPEVVKIGMQHQGDAPDALRLTLENDGDAYRAITKKFPELDSETWADEVMRDVFNDSQNAVDVKFSQYQTPGADEGSYREALFTLPDKAPSGWTAERLNDPDAGFNHWQINDADGKQVTRIVGGTEESAIRKAAEGPQFKSQHFDEPNIIVHARYNTRDLAGGKSLFGEEFQSDAATAKRKGQEVDMPFIDKPGKWASLVMKRMLRKAIEENLDSISWTSGDMQAARYDLSKQIDTLGVTGNPSKGFSLDLIKGRGSIASYHGISPDKLADHVGKDLAGKIMWESEVAGGPISHEFSGLDLKVGGEGMKGFYDKILPSVANDIAKKFGGKVEQASLNTPETKARYEPTPDGILDTETNKLVEEFDDDAIERMDESAAQDLADQWNQDNVSPLETRPAATEKVWMLKITPGMRKSIMEVGQPMFLPKIEGAMPPKESSKSIGLRGAVVPDIDEPLPPE